MSLEPERVLDAVPYTVEADLVVLFVQMPSIGIYDGLYVAYDKSSIWIPMAHGSTKATVSDLNPGTLYEFQIFVTSRNMKSEGFSVRPVRTCE